MAATGRSRYKKMKKATLERVNQFIPARAIALREEFNAMKQKDPYLRIHSRLKNKKKRILEQKKDRKNLLNIERTELRKLPKNPTLDSYFDERLSDLYPEKSLRAQAIKEELIRLNTEIDLLKREISNLRMRMTPRKMALLNQFRKKLAKAEKQRDTMQTRFLM